MKIPKKTLDELRNKWKEVGIKTDPINADKSKEYIDQIYQNSGFPPPEFYFVARCPQHAVKIKMALDEFGYERVSTADDPIKLVMDRAEAINHKPTSSVFLASQICFGNQEAPILSFYDYFINYCSDDVSVSDHVKPYMALAEHCGWWIPMTSAVILVERPEQIKFDQDERVHCEHGPAITYRNSDFGVFAWHGVQVPSEWIMNKESLTPTIALTHENMEQRRVACEILGWDKIIEQLSGVRIIDTNPDPEIGQLIEAELPEIGTERFLRVVCGTKRVFCLPVPPTVETALEANAWTYGLAANEYIPEVRT